MNPFDLDNDVAYQRWRDEKLNNHPATLDELVVEVADLAAPTAAERQAILAAIARANMAVYVSKRPSAVDKKALKAFAAHFGLRRLNHNEGADDEGITALSVVAGDQWRRTYIPYTNRAIHWHTDGYYNTPAEQIHGLMLYCETPAPEGGENALLDHEMAYIHLRDANPDYIRALSQPDAMTIPANEVNDHVQRPDRPGPVFSVDADGNLHMRYTARKRNVVWKDDLATREAALVLGDFLASDGPWIFRATLKTGQGLLCNNVLHDRSGFSDTDEQKRLLYRLRFYDRIAG